jgi:hypothetical protein
MKMVTDIESPEFKFMQSILTELKVMNDHLLEIRNELKFKNDMEFPMTARKYEIKEQEIV